MVIRKKLVVVGDGTCGKTSLLTVYKEKRFPTEYLATLFETYITSVKVDDFEVDLTLYDTAGQEGYDRLRSLSYPNTNVLLVCFSVDSPTSLANVKDLWIPEIKFYCPPDTPIILVGNKKDLRNDPITTQTLKRNGQLPIGTDEGLAIAKKINAYKYLECSAKNNDGVTEVFETATRAALNLKKKKCLCCNLL